MEVFDLQQNWQKVVVEKLALAVNPAFVIVFGSYAQGSAREDSDLDIAYFAERQLSAYERFLLAGEIAQSCNIDVDLVDILTVEIQCLQHKFFQVVLSLIVKMKTPLLKSV